MVVSFSESWCLAADITLPYFEMAEAQETNLNIASQANLALTFTCVCVCPLRATHWDPMRDTQPDSVHNSQYLLWRQRTEGDEPEPQQDLVLTLSNIALVVTYGVYTCKVDRKLRLPYLGDLQEG